MIKSFFKWIASAAVVLSFTACQNDDPQKPAVDPRGDEYTVGEVASVSDSRAADLARGQQQFAYALADELATPGENFVYSPMSLYNLLGLIANGADGNTAKEISAALYANNTDEIVALCRRQIDRFNEIDAEANAFNRNFLDNKEGAEQEFIDAFLAMSESMRTKASIVNGLWIDPKRCSPYPTYVEECRKWLNAEVANVDFSNPEQTKQSINSRISQATNGLIPELLGQLPVSTEMVCANALYLNAKWTYGMTELNDKQPFNNIDGSKSMVTTLSSLQHYAYAENDDCLFISLPLGDFLELTEEHLFSFSIVMPKGQKTPEEFINANINEMAKAATANGEILLTIPAFELNVRPDAESLINAFNALGLVDAFTSKANFGRITSSQFFVDQIVHQAIVKVTESGVEAAAGSANIWVSESLKPKPEPRLIKIDRPFLFQITDNRTNTVLFLGTVNTL